MSTPINGPGSLLFAAAASHAKGHETSATQSNDEREKKRAIRAILFGAKQEQQQHQTNEAEKSFLA